MGMAATELFSPTGRADNFEGRNKATHRLPTLALARGHGHGQGPGPFVPSLRRPSQWAASSARGWDGRPTHAEMDCCSVAAAAQFQFQFKFAETTVVNQRRQSIQGIPYSTQYHAAPAQAWCVNPP